MNNFCYYYYYCYRECKDGYVYFSFRKNCRMYYTNKCLFLIYLRESVDYVVLSKKKIFCSIFYKGAFLQMLEVRKIDFPFKTFLKKYFKDEWSFIQHISKVNSFSLINVEKSIF